jgi:hypothetical protein
MVAVGPRAVEYSTVKYQLKSDAGASAAEDTLNQKAIAVSILW